MRFPVANDLVRFLSSKIFLKVSPFLGEMLNAKFPLSFGGLWIRVHAIVGKIEHASIPK